MSKRGTRNDTLRLVTDAEADSRTRRGARLRALREALHLTQQEVADLSVDAAKRLDHPDYKPIERTVVNKDEAGEGQFQKDAVCAVYSRVFGITRDQFADYIREKLSLDELLALRAEASTTASISSRGRTTIYGDATKWGTLTEEARRLAAFQGVELTDETLAELRDMPFVSGPPNTIDAPLVALQAIALQAWKRRSVGK